MRWKLLIITSVAAALLGVGGSAGLLYLLTGSAAPHRQPGLIAAGPLLFPLAVITFASVFVYRHTARRRKTQAAATALISLALTLAVFSASTFYVVCCEPPPRPLPAPTPPGAT
ncbi:MAG: hypothetical protein LC800_22185 [Acidobacteria bacterium]|nr:hypothetical protein [Acidobacteriota bacterium]